MATKDTQNQEEDAVLDTDTDHADKRVYELGFHIDAELSPEDIKKAFQDIKDVAVKGGGSLVAEGEPNKLTLAYTISRMSTTGRRDFSTSYFGWVVYEADGAAHENVLKTLGADLRVIRFIDLRTTKEAAKHSAEMHEFYRNIPEVVEEEESNTADVELDAALKEAGVA